MNHAKLVDMSPHLLTSHSGLILLAGTAAAATCGAIALAVQRHRTAMNRVRGSRRQIALTFDDGPSEATPAVLDLLAKHRVRATFFVCGKNVKRLPEIARAITEAGHELANHTHHHVPMGPRKASGWKVRSTANMLQEMRKAQTCIHHHTGVWPRYFRAPYGSWWFGLRRAQQRLGVRGVGCSVTANEAAWTGEQIADFLVRGTEPGGIVCLHDGNGLYPDPDLRNTLAALDLALPQWKARGFRIGTVHELMRANARKPRVRHRRSGELQAQTSSTAR